MELLDQLEAENPEDSSLAPKVKEHGQAVVDSRVCFQDRA